MAVITSNLTDPTFGSGGLRSINYVNALNQASTLLDQFLSGPFTVVSSDGVSNANITFSGGSGSVTGSFIGFPSSFSVSTLNLNFSGSQNFSLSGTMSFPGSGVPPSPTVIVLGSHNITNMQTSAPNFSLGVTGSFSPVANTGTVSMISAFSGSTEIQLTAGGGGFSVAGDGTLSGTITHIHMNPFGGGQTVDFTNLSLDLATFNAAFNAGTPLFDIAASALGGDDQVTLNNT